MLGRNGRLQAWEFSAEEGFKSVLPPTQLPVMYEYRHAVPAASDESRSIGSPTSTQATIKRSRKDPAAAAATADVAPAQILRASFSPMHGISSFLRSKHE